MSTVTLEGPPGRAGGTIAALSADLARARRRAAAFGLVRAAAIGVAVALAVFSVLQLGFQASGSSGWLARNVLLASGAAGLVAFVAIAVLNGVRNPGIPRFARAADRVFGTKERLSTALELSAAPATPLTSVGTALFQDIDERSDKIDVRRLVPFRVPLVAAGAFVALAIVAGFLAFRPAPVGTLAVPQVAAPLTAAQRDEIGADIRRVAALVEADAVDRADPYLQAVARELQQLGLAIAGGAPPDRAEIARALERLLPHATQAYERAGVGEAAPENLSRLIEAALREVRPPTPGTPGGVNPEFPPGMFPPGTPAGTPAPGAAGEDVVAGGEAPAEGLGDMLAALERPEAAQFQLPSPAPPQEGEVDNGYDYIDPNDVALQLERQRNDAARQGQAGGAPAGAAAEAGVGEGDAAGEGVQPLENGAVTTFGEPLAVVGEMVIGDPNQGDGQRIRMDMPPEGGDLALRAGDRNDGGGWRQLPEREVDRGLLPPQDRGVVQQYFRTLTQGGA